ncbi:including n-acetylases of ribosomal protein [Dendryphion nanum]|uniref:Including n-acetylases of ribosomal protein n=1 Tax=Dendryphion nanum TaxID=256645 RepID=A0A9P9IDK4_9PLEO|nr:including n-acetylases of ribosomal protein [Dendryphion nanum]
MGDLNFRIETPRLYLSYFDPSLVSHCDFLLNLYTTPEIYKGNKGSASHIETREDSRNSIISNSHNQAKTGYGRYIISLKPSEPQNNDSRQFVDTKEDLEKIGIVSFKLRKHLESPRVPDVGFHLFPRYWGKGYATEAASALIEYFEKERGQKDVVGYCSPENEESKRMFKRLGFKERGVRPIRLNERLDAPAVHALVWTKAGMDSNLEDYGL